MLILGSVNPYVMKTLWYTKFKFNEYTVLSRNHMFFPTFKIYFPYFQVKHVKPEKRNILIRSQIKGDIFSEKNIDELDTMFRPYQYERFFSIHMYHLKKNCVRQKNNVLGVVDLFESEIFTANFRNQGYSFAEWTSGKKNMMENCNPNSLGKNRVVCFVWKKSWFDSVNSLIWFFHAGKLHQVSHLMCWRWTSVAKNNHWSFRCPRFFGHFWNPFGAAHSQESTTNFEGTMIRQQGRFPNFLDQLPLLEKLSAGTSRLHQFFEKEN